MLGLMLSLKVNSPSWISIRFSNNMHMCLPHSQYSNIYAFNNLSVKVLLDLLTYCFAPMNRDSCSNEDRFWKIIRVDISLIGSVFITSEG